ncbi:FusB/FusC family EF-G-binding protein [Lysinibacillus sp. FSL W8-0992]|uniref:FusB/FusC family EF-G-binding protein n=1 Tax=Lysinibacillus sp. FSL W8-0992 TaxID=2954643 RepID=UPI0030F4C3C4
MEKQAIQPFLTVANYNLLGQQMNKILQTIATSKDTNVVQTVRGLVQKEISENVVMTNSEAQLIEPIYSVTERAAGESYLQDLKLYVIPFKPITASTIKSLFKKEKKLKLPNLERLDFQQICYFAWDDLGTHRKYVILEQDDKLKAIKGTFANNTVRGICAICNRHADVGLFTTSIKGNVVGTYTNHSNYICADSDTCNQHVTDMNKTITFFERIT